MNIDQHDGCFEDISANEMKHVIMYQDQIDTTNKRKEKLILYVEHIINDICCDLNSIPIQERLIPKHAQFCPHFTCKIKRTSRTCYIKFVQFM